MDASIRHLIPNNVLPSKYEAESVSSLLAADISEVERLNTLISSLLSERDMLNARIESYRSILSPIRMLPLDILGEIFVRCLPEHNPVMCRKEAPLVLGRVCSLWRSLSLHLPVLWAGLHVVIPSTQYVQRLAFVIEGIETWLGRSGSLPLSLSVFGNGRYGSGWQESPSLAIIKALLGYKDRWYRVSLNVPSVGTTVLWDVPGTDLPMLQSLCLKRGIVPLASAEQLERHQPQGVMGIISGPILADARTLDWTGMTLFQARNLTRVALPSQTFTEYGLLTFLPLSQLTDLDMRHCLSVSYGVLPLSTVLNVLRRCDKLQGCHIKIDHSTDPSSYSQVDLPFVHTLTIEETRGVPDFPADFDIFTVLRTPALKHLSYHFVGPDKASQRVFEHRFDLESLSLVYPPLSAEALREYLERNRNLERLKISGGYYRSHPTPIPGDEPPTSCVDEGFLDFLHPPSLPKLHSVDFRQSINIEPESVIGFLRARSRSESERGEGWCALRYASFPFAQPSDGNFGKEIERLEKEEGMSVVFHQPRARKIRRDSAADGLREFMEDLV